MVYTKLGKSDLNVSRICMGCMGIGDPSKGMNKWAVPEEESIHYLSGLLGGSDGPFSG